MSECIGIINLDENVNDFEGITSKENLASIEFAGKYRIIDFVLSNLNNSDIEEIGIFSHKKSDVLLKYLTNNKFWKVNQKNNKINIFNYGEYNICEDDIHNFMDNIEFIKRSKKEYVIITPSYMICNIDYKKVLEFHKNNNNDITTIYKKQYLKNDKFLNCEELMISVNNKVIDIKKVIKPKEFININMEMYIMNTKLFLDIITNSITNGLYKKVKDYIKSNLNNLDIKAYEFRGYLSCINSTKAFFKSNKEVLDVNINNELFYSNGIIYSDFEDSTPTYYSNNSKVINSIISNGSYIEGKVENSVIGKNVKIGKGAIVKNSVLMSNVNIEEGCIINNIIINQNNKINNYEVYSGKENNPKVL